jgi:hypothetical protein
MLRRIPPKNMEVPRALPVGLHYTFYLPDDEFPASATCLFAANASTFMPLAGLADTAEFTARRIIELVSKE